MASLLHVIGIVGHRFGPLAEASVTPTNTDGAVGTGVADHLHVIGIAKRTRRRTPFIR